METFIAVKDKADGNTVKLADEENNNLDKVKVLIDDKQDEEDESLPEVENPISSEIAMKIEETDMPMLLLALIMLN